MFSGKKTAESDLRIARQQEEAQTDSSSSNWEKCARTLSLNTREELLDLRVLLQTLCSNIVSNPGDNKYRTIKLNNKTLEKRLLNRKGGLEFLAAAGFKTIVIDAIRCLQLLHEEEEIAIKLVEIDDALDWLGDTVDICLAIANSSERCVAAHHDVCMWNGLLTVVILQVCCDFRMLFINTNDVISHFTLSSNGEDYLRTPD